MKDLELKDNPVPLDTNVTVAFPKERLLKYVVLSTVPSAFRKPDSPPDFTNPSAVIVPVKVEILYPCIFYTINSNFRHR